MPIIEVVEVVYVFEDLKKSFEASANLIPDWRSCSKLSLAIRYVENEKNELLRDAYFGAIALRYWYRIPILCDKSRYLIRNAKVTCEDVTDWFFEAIQKVLKDRPFMDDTKFKYIDDNEDKFINHCIYTAIENIRKNYFQYYNYQKRGGELYTESLDTYIETKGDDFPQENNNSKYMAIDTEITNLVKEGRTIEALVLYTIVYGDVFVPRVDAKNRDTMIFSRDLLRQRISTMEECHINAFIKEYCDGVDIDSYEISRFSNYTIQWKRILIGRALKFLSKRSGILDICY